jgi:hypothetical protein
VKFRRWFVFLHEISNESLPFADGEPFTVIHAEAYTGNHGGAGFAVRACFEKATFPRTTMKIEDTISDSTIITTLSLQNRQNPMSELQNFQNLFRLDGKVALITGGNVSAPQWRASSMLLTISHRVERTRASYCNSFPPCRRKKGYHNGAKSRQREWH